MITILKLIFKLIWGIIKSIIIVTLLAVVAVIVLWFLMETNQGDFIKEYICLN